MEIKHLSNHLMNIPNHDWAPLFDFISEIEKSKWFDKTNAEYASENPLFIQNTSKKELITKIVASLYDLDIIPTFDRTNWDEGKAIINNDKSEYDSLDMVTLCKLFTVLIRADRFNEGFLLLKFEDGTIPKILTTLRKHVLNLNNMQT